jgi:SET domain-containing protein
VASVQWGPPPDDVWLDRRVAVRASPIEGRGLFATEPIPAGEVVLRLGGRLVGTEELAELIAVADADPQLPYVDTITVHDDEHLVLPAASPAHFGNHSCNPTTWIGGPYELVARRDLEAGEELTLDYGTISGAPGFVMACRCGSALCRGEVTSDDWRRPELRARYGARWVPALASP